MKKYTAIYLGAFVLLAIIDTLTAYMVKVKQPYFNETNPLYIATGSFLALIVLKLLVVGFIVAFMLRWYKNRMVYIRFMFVVYIVLGIVGQAKGITHNIGAFMQQPEEVINYTDEQKQASYNENFGRVDVSIASFLFNLLLLFFSWWKIDNEYFNYRVDAA